MTKFDYSKLAGRADAMIDRYGTTGFLRRKTDATSWDAVATNKDYPIKLVLSDYTDNDRKNTLILQGDRRIMFSAVGLSIAPRMGDQIFVSGDTTPYSIVNLNIIQPAMVPVAYTAQVRR